MAGSTPIVKAAFDSGDEGTLAVAIDGASWSGQGIVSGVSMPTPADGAVTCTATFQLSDWTYTAPTL